MSPVPQLPNITSLTIDAQWQHLEASIAKLIAKCSRLERLTIDIARPVSRNFHENFIPVLVYWQ
jgi:hypothetical protein